MYKEFFKLDTRMQFDEFNDVIEAKNYAVLRHAKQDDMINMCM